MSLRTPGFTKQDRIKIAALSGRDERSIAKFLRRECITQAVFDDIAAAAKELGYVRPPESEGQ